MITTPPGRFTVYVGDMTPQQFQRIGDYTLPDGSPAINVVCIFGGNYAASTLPYLRAQNNTPPTNQPFNDYIQTLLDSGAVRYLQDKGITVLMTVLNGQHPVGWSEFTSSSDAGDFARYLSSDVVAKYGLNGIDVDDEYSTGTPNDTSLAMVTTLLKQTMQAGIITKALFADDRYFGPSWEGHTLPENLTYGWEMSYGGQPQYRLPHYTKLGLSPAQISLGFWSNQPSSDPAGDVQWLKDNGYGGVMVFAFEEAANQRLTAQLLNAWYGAGNWRSPG